DWATNSNAVKTCTSKSWNVSFPPSRGQRPLRGERSCSHKYQFLKKIYRRHGGALIPLLVSNKNLSIVVYRPLQKYYSTRNATTLLPVAPYHNECSPPSGCQAVAREEARPALLRLSVNNR
ncbi:unnamed protein product, partial [Ectocarpus sp. 12 AP-2014]